MGILFKIFMLSMEIKCVSKDVRMYKSDLAIYVCVCVGVGVCVRTRKIDDKNILGKLPPNG